MAWLSPQSWEPNESKGPLTTGVRLYLVPFYTMTFLTLAESVQYTPPSPPSSGTRGYGFAA